MSDFADKIENLTGFPVPPGNLVTVLFQLGEMATATESLDAATFEVLGAELGYKVQIVSPEDEDKELLESFDIDLDEEENEEDLVIRPPSSPLWVTSITVRRSCWTPFGARTWSPVKRVESPSTSVPTRCGLSTRVSSGPSPSSIHPVTRPSPPCVPVVLRSPTSRFWWWLRTTESCLRPLRR
jgi:hypothetical protein